MKISEIAATLRRAAVDMETLATTDGDLDYPDEIVLPFILNFLTDDPRRFSTHKASKSARP